MTYLLTLRSLLSHYKYKATREVFVQSRDFTGTVTLFYGRIARLPAEIATRRVDEWEISDDMIMVSVI